MTREISSIMPKNTASGEAGVHVQASEDMPQDAFSVLRHHARVHTLTIATQSEGRRAITYRRLWSRIERATARLQVEWGISKGDVVVYWGDVHQDLLVLYFALARCGARLLSLENATLRARYAESVPDISPVLIVHDDVCESTLPQATAHQSLAAMLAVRCHHEPQIFEDISLPTLLTIDDSRDMCIAQLGLQLRGGGIAETKVVSNILLEPVYFAQEVWPVLLAGGRLQFP